MSDITATQKLVPYETRMMHTSTSCGVSIRSVNQKSKNEHGKDITVRFAEIKNPNGSDTKNLVGLLQRIDLPRNEITSFRTANDINYPHPPKMHNQNMPGKENAHTQDAKVLLSQGEPKPETEQGNNVVFPMQKSEDAPAPKLTAETNEMVTENKENVQVKITPTPTPKTLVKDAKSNRK